MKTKNTILTLSLSICLIFLLPVFISSIEKSEKDEEFANNFINKYSIYALNTPENINFCKELTPITDLDIQERFDKELLSNTYFHSNTILYLKKTNKWFPIITPILEKYGIPDDFKYLAVVESNLSNVVSPSGAAGFWQLMRTTGKSLDLEIRQEVDERYHLVKSTEAACKYLLKAYSEFNNWTLSAAAYNMGIDGLKRQLKKQQTNNYYDLYLNSETARYVFRILAVKDILSHPNNYGFKFLEKHLYTKPKTHEITIDSSIVNLAFFAKRQGINYKILKTLNPWLRKNKLTNTAKKAYEITIPDTGYYTHSTLPVIDTLNSKLKENSTQINIKN